MNNEVVNRKKYIIIGVAFLVVAALALLITVLVRNFSLANKIELTVLVAPESAKILINGKEYKNGTYDFSPGTYSISISADGFEEKTVELTANSGEIALLYDYLLPTSGKYSLNDYKLLKYLSKDEKTSALLEARANAVAFVSILPLEYSSLTVSDDSDSSSCPADPNLCIKISSSSLSESEAIDFLKSEGYDLSDLVISFERE